MTLLPGSFSTRPQIDPLQSQRIQNRQPLAQSTASIEEGFTTPMVTKRKDIVGEEEPIRVRISAKPRQAQQIYGENKSENLMQILHETNGVMYPYTPIISHSSNVDYSSYTPVHSIQEFLAYQRTPSPSLTIIGTFTAQNSREARYALACIHFFRTITKMYFGKGDNVGAPPPVLLLNGYGSFMFNNLPILITSYNVEFQNNIDYVKINIKRSSKISGLDNSKTNPVDLLSTNRALMGSPTTRQDKGEGTAWIPSLFQISCTAVVQHTPKTLREFNLNKFRTGQLLKERKSNSGGGWW